jgi:hypothetical protein
VLLDDTDPEDIEMLKEYGMELVKNNREEIEKVVEMIVDEKIG